MANGTLRDAFAAMITLLGADSTLNNLGVSANDIFALKAPESHSTPFVIFEKYSATHDFVLGGSGTYDTHYILIKVVSGGQGDYSMGDLSRQISDRIVAILTGFKPSLPTGYIIRIEPQTDIEFSESESGNILFYHVGTVFKIYIGHN